MYIIGMEISVNKKLYIRYYCIKYCEEIDRNRDSAYFPPCSCQGFEKVQSLHI